jgi:hypothetical protein
MGLYDKLREHYSSRYEFEEKIIENLGFRYFPIGRLKCIINNIAIIMANDTAMIIPVFI